MIDVEWTEVGSVVRRNQPACEPSGECLALIRIATEVSLLDVRSS